MNAPRTRQVRCTAGLLALALVLTGPILPAPAQTTRERGIGPFQVLTKRGEITVRLLRRDRQLVWVDQQVSSGRFVETALAPDDLVRFNVPTPPVFDAADRATTPDQIAQVLVALQRMTDPLKPYRDLPGVPLDAALLRQGLLLERAGRWENALKVYEDILAQKYQPPEVTEARLRSALCHARLNRNDRVLELLADQSLPDDDLALLSDLVFARAQAHAAQGQYEQAVLDFLYLVVFHPFVQENESRCLAAVLPSYAALQDWEAASQTLAALRKQYPDAQATRQAEPFAQQYQKELAAEEAYATPEAAAGEPEAEEEKTP